MNSLSVAVCFTHWSGMAASLGIGSLGSSAVGAKAALKAVVIPLLTGLCGALLATFLEAASISFLLLSTISLTVVALFQRSCFSVLDAVGAMVIVCAVLAVTINSLSADIRNALIVAIPALLSVWLWRVYPVVDDLSTLKGGGIEREAGARLAILSTLVATAVLGLFGALVSEIFAVRPFVVYWFYFVKFLGASLVPVLVSIGVLWCGGKSIALALYVISHIGGITIFLISTSTGLLKSTVFGLAVSLLIYLGAFLDSLISNMCLLQNCSISIRLLVPFLAPLLTSAQVWWIIHSVRQLEMTALFLLPIVGFGLFLSLYSGFRFVFPVEWRTSRSGPFNCMHDALYFSATGGAGILVPFGWLTLNMETPGLLPLWSTVASIPLAVVFYVASAWKFAKRHIRSVDEPMCRAVRGRLCRQYTFLFLLLTVGWSVVAVSSAT